MNITKLIILIVVLFNLSDMFSQVNCDGNSIVQIIPSTISYNENSCNFSVSATSSRINNTCQNSLNACPMNTPCFGYCYEWRLFLNNSIIDIDCTISNTNTFTNLTSNGNYRLLIIYKRLVFCLNSNSPQCGIMIDQSDFNISDNVCNIITINHNNNQSAVIKKSNDITLNCVIQNNKTTKLTSETKIKALPNSRSGTGANTFFHAKIENCDGGGRTGEVKDNITNKEIISEDYIQEILKEFSYSDLSQRKISFHTIYPNPNKGQFTIELNNTPTESTIEIYDVMGKKVWSKISSENKVEIDISTQPKGIYLVKVVSENNVIVQKIVYD